MTADVDFATTVIASGLRARSESLDLIAHNVANANTVAYKADQERYRVFVPEWIESGSQEYSDWAKSPELGKASINFVQGSLDRTDSPLDLAIEGKGFFTVEGGPSNASAQFLTRSGNFQLGTDGQIRNRDGFKLKLLRLDGGPIDPNFRLDPSQPLKIKGDGVLTQNGVDLARVSISEVDDAQALLRQGSSYFSWEGKKPQNKSSGFSIHQGMLERANYDPMAGSVQLINVSRQFEMLQKALQLHSEMGRRVGEEIGKV